MYKVNCKCFAHEVDGDTFTEELTVYPEKNDKDEVFELLTEIYDSFNKTRRPIEKIRVLDRFEILDAEPYK